MAAKHAEQHGWSCRHGGAFGYSDQLRCGHAVDAHLVELLHSDGPECLFPARRVVARSEAESGCKWNVEPERPTEFSDSGDRAEPHHYAVGFKFSKDNCQPEQPAD